MKHNNPSISQDMNRIFDLKGEDTSDLLDYITPTIEIKPRIDIIRSQYKTTTGTNAVYTTPSDKDFYLCGLTFNYMTDAAADTTSYVVVVTIDGVARNLLDLRKITGTADRQVIFLSFNNPIKVDRNTAINQTHTFTAGVSVMSTTIWGYTQETIKGV